MPVVARGVQGRFRDLIFSPPALPAIALTIHLNLIARDLKIIEGHRYGTIQALHPVPPSCGNKEKIARFKSHLGNIDTPHSRKLVVVRMIEIERAEELSVIGNIVQMKRRDEFDLFVPITLHHHHGIWIMMMTGNDAFWPDPYTHTASHTCVVALSVQAVQMAVRFLKFRRARKIFLSI